VPSTVLAGAVVAGAVVLVVDVVLDVVVDVDLNGGAKVVAPLVVAT
jgi:hypothetical protein